MSWTYDPSTFDDPEILPSWSTPAFAVFVEQINNATTALKTTTKLRVFTHSPNVGAAPQQPLEIYTVSLVVFTRQQVYLT
jgi:hypothetical protein